MKARHVYLSDHHVSELAGQGEDAEEIDLAECGLEEAVVGSDGLVGAVVVAGNAAQLCDLQKGRG